MDPQRIYFREALLRDLEEARALHTLDVEFPSATVCPPWFRNLKFEFIIKNMRRHSLRRRRALKT